MASPNFRPGMRGAGLARAAALCTLAGLAMLAASGSPSIAAGDAQTEDGAELYRQHCASCHGSTGEGDGPVAERLKAPPQPLTTLSERNAGVFPTEYVHRIIDGREERKEHGSRVMPVWGTYYGLRAQTQGRDAPDTETAIRTRISSLIAYLETIQVGTTATAVAARSLVDRHVDAFRARDLDAIMNLYTDESVLAKSGGVLRGRTQIRDYYEALFAEFDQPGATFDLLEQMVVGNVAHIVWRGETPGSVYERASETFAVEAGKIRYQIAAVGARAR